MSQPIPTPSPSRVRSTRTAAVESDTREAIVRAALMLFAKHGIDGVSLRQIVMAAGQSNPSAVHYHFRSKEGLVSAVLDHVRDQLVPMQDRATESMLEARSQGRLTVREVVRLLVMPMILVYSASSEGRMSVRFLARLMWQTDDAASISRLMNHCANSHAQVVSLLHELMPHQSAEKINFLVMASITNLLHGLADISVLGRHTSLGLQQLYKERSLEIVDWFIDYVAAGLDSSAAQHGQQASGRAA